MDSVAGRLATLGPRTDSWPKCLAGLAPARAERRKPVRGPSAAKHPGRQSVRELGLLSAQVVNPCRS